MPPEPAPDGPAINFTGSPFMLFAGPAGACVARFDRAGHLVSFVGELRPPALAQKLAGAETGATASAVGDASLLHGELQHSGRAPLPEPMASQLLAAALRISKRGEAGPFTVHAPHSST